MTLPLALIAIVLSVFSTTIALLVAHRLAQLSATNARQFHFDPAELDAAGPTIASGTPVPSLTLNNSKRLHGLRLTDLATPALILFVSGLCTSCSEVIDEVQARLSDQRRDPITDGIDSRVIILSVGPGGSKRLLSQLADHPTMLWSLTRTEQRQIRRLFGIDATPAYCLIEDSAIASCGLANSHVSEWNAALEYVIPTTPDIE